MIPRAKFGVIIEGGLPQAPDIALARRRLEKQLAEAAEVIKGTWRAVTKRVGAIDTGAYLQGISENARVTITILPTGDMQVSGVVEVVNTAPHALLVEDGHSAFHLPSQIDWGSSPRVKRSKVTGRRYLHIPFRHFAFSENKPGDQLRPGALRQMMPADVYQQAKGLRQTRRLKLGPQHAPDGRYLARDKYAWGDRLQLNHPSHRSQTGTFRQDRLTGGYVEHQRGERYIPNVRMPDGSRQGRQNAAWQAPKHEGMFRSRRGPSSDSKYYTIRTLTEDSPNWNIPAQAGKGIAGATANFFRSSQGQAMLQARMAAAVRSAL